MILRLVQSRQNSVGHLGLAREFEAEVQLSPAEMCEAMEQILTLAKRYQNRITAQAGPLSLARAYQEMEKARLEGREIPGRGYLTGCGCMWQKITVRPDGVYVPCGMLSPYYAWEDCNRFPTQHLAEPSGVAKAQKPIPDTSFTIS